MSPTEDVARLSTYVLFVDYGREVEVQHTVRGTTWRVDRATHADLLTFCSFRRPDAAHSQWLDRGVLVPPFKDTPEYHGGLRPGTEAQLGADYSEWYWKREVESEREYRWLGRTVLKMPSDLFFYQELIVAHGLRSVLEIGYGDGGALCFFANVLGLLGGGQVVGVDRDGAMLPHNDPTRRATISTMTGDAQESGTVDALRRAHTRGFGLVILDADPTPAGKLALLGRWAALVAPGGILALEDVESPACHAQGGMVEGVDRFLLERRHFGIAPEAARVPVLKARGAVLRRLAK